MKSTILITGAGPHGVTGKLINEYLQNKYRVLAPSSAELDLTNDVAVSNFFESNHIDYVIHCATFRESTCNTNNLVNEELESNLRMYYALASQSYLYKKMIYFGSGAEFDKSLPIVCVQETDFGRSIPKNKYGLAKYIMNCHASTSNNIYNFRLFGTINQYERYNKNIVSNLCVKAIMGMDMNLQQDCRFSFIDINDILPIIDYALTHNLLYHDYNITLDNSYLLSEIASIVLSISKSKSIVSFKKTGLNLEYTGVNSRFRNEFKTILSSIETSIKRVYDYHYERRGDLIIDDIDNRWENAKK